MGTHGTLFSTGGWRTPIRRALARYPTGGIEMEKKEALLKRRQEPKRISLEQLNKDYIKRQLADAEAEAKEKYGINELRKSDLDQADNYLFFARIKEIQAILGESVLSRKFIKTHWSDEYDYITNNTFPYGWMDQKGIMKTFDQNKPLLPILNYLHNTAKKAKKRDRDIMNQLSGEAKHNKHPISCFVADANFYKKAVAAIGLSERTIQRYIKQFIAIEAIRKIAAPERNLRVLSFGYYTQWDGREQHRTYLKETTVFKRELRNFMVT